MIVWSSGMSIDAPTLYRLISRVFQTIRAEALVRDAPVLRTMVTLLEPLPSQLSSRSSPQEYADLLHDLSTHAHQHNAGRWLDWAVSDQQAFAPDSRVMLHRIIHVLLVELRTKAYETGNMRLFNLSDLCHNLPLQLERVTHVEDDCTEIVIWLRQRAAQRDLTGWLEHEFQERSGQNRP